MDIDVLSKAIATLPPGRWAVGVSGGADSVALLLLLRARQDLSLHVAHLDHQTRNGESSQDAAFVSQLAERIGVPCSVGLRSDIEPGISNLPRNTSSRFRKVRFAFFRQIVAVKNVRGVLLAHHADDQVETVLLRILRGAGVAGLSGIRAESHIQGLEIRRPLLEISSAELREFLRQTGQEWREDSSNQSDMYARNRVRRWHGERNACVAVYGGSSAEATLASRLQTSLIEVESASTSLRNWLDAGAPMLEDTFNINTLANAPLPLARHAAARWLLKQGAPAADLNALTCERLVEMATDAASSGRQDFPGGINVRRHRGQIFVDY